MYRFAPGLPSKASLNRSLYAGRISARAYTHIDHCINNNSTIIVIYRDVLPSALRYGAG